MNTATSQQYTDYNHRQLPSIEASRTNQNTAVSNSYGYANEQTISSPPAVAPPLASTSNVPEPYNSQNTTTVDPMAVYDPWPEYQRKQETLRAQKAIEDAARAKEERIAEEARKLEEQKQEDERKRQEEEKEARQAQIAARQPNLRKEPQNQQLNVVEASSAATASSDGPNEIEAQIRAMMAKMRELNNKDPALLARIWEEEKRAKAPVKSPTVQTKPTSQPTTVHSAQPVPVAATTLANSATPIANQRKKTISRQPAAASVTKPATPIPTQPVPARPQSQTNTRSGNTLWPPERKLSLANVATTYLNGLNPNNFIEASQILGILDGNPSYIELCEELEQRGLKLDRAALAKTLLSSVPDVNSMSRRAVLQPPSQAQGVKKAPVPAAVMKKDLVATSPHSTFAAASPAPRPSYQPFPDDASAVDLPTPVAEMVPIRADLKPPANKEEAARKRNLSDLVDLTLLSDEDMGPPPKRLNMNATSSGPPYSHMHHTVGMNEHSTVNNFPSATVPSHPGLVTHVVQLPQDDIRNRNVVQPLDRTKALRRNTYNPATIARDVLLACGRYPGERQLNQHLEILKQSIDQITNDSDLSTIRWDIIDPGSPPPGYFVSSVQALVEDADDEEDEKDEDKSAQPQSVSHAMGGERGASARVQALPQATNPFTKQKRRGRPPRQSLPNPTLPTTPNRPSDSATMSASAPRASGVGYSAFRVDENGKPLPKKRGRPVGWRKAIHGSPAAQARQSPDGHVGPARHQPSQPSGLRNVRTDGENDPIRINSRSPSVANRNPQYQSYKCKWQNCSAELHNLETLKKHIYKVHRKMTLRGTLECLWDDCGREVTNHEPKTKLMTERYLPLAFLDEKTWHEHIDQTHLGPLSWQLGDGPASGLSGKENTLSKKIEIEMLTDGIDAHDSDAYLSDAQGRRVTPRMEVDAKRFTAGNSSAPTSAPAPRGRGRHPKNVQEQEARDFQNHLVSQKKRMGGPGMDRGGATLVNDKRRRGFSDDDGTEEELVDAED